MKPIVFRLPCRTCSQRELIIFQWACGCWDGLCKLCGDYSSVDCVEATIVLGESVRPLAGMAFL